MPRGARLHGCGGVREGGVLAHHLDLFKSNTTRAARAAQGCTKDRVRVDAGVRLASDEVTKSGRTGITTAYTQNMLSRKRTLWTA